MLNSVEHSCTLGYINESMEAEKKENILPTVLAALESGNLIISFHAIEQMEAREIVFSDVKEALYQGQREEQKNDYRQNPKSKKSSGAMPYED